MANYFVRKNIIATGLIVLVWCCLGIAYMTVNWYINAVIENHKGWFGEIPGFEILENPPTEYTSYVYAADGTQLGGGYFRSNRNPVPYDSLSKNVINALVATEDVRYYEHSGVDLRGLMSIPLYLLKGKKKGASTVSQQLAKNLFAMREDKRYEGTWYESKLKKILAIKTKEWITAVRLEENYTKEEIMAMYLNTVDFGSNSFGIQVASQTFFGKDQSDLTYEEAAVLIGLLKATSKYNPKAHPEASLDRRNIVLSQLHKYDYLTDQAYDSIKELPLVLDFKVDDHNQGPAPYFRKVLKNYLVGWCKRNGYDLFADGLKVYTTLDLTMQKYAEEAAHEHMEDYQKIFNDHWKGKNPWTFKNEDDEYEEIANFLNTQVKKTENYRHLYRRFDGDSVKIYKELNKKKPMKVFTYQGTKDTTFSLIDSLGYYMHFLHAGFMAMDPVSGEIKAWVGGIDHEYFKYDHVMQGKRQPGSTFKPIVYATILGESDGAYTPCFKAVDAPVSFETGDPENPTWTPQNAMGVFTGDTMTLRQAMARSKNSITAYMMKIMGEQTPQMVKRYARNLGITSPLAPVPAMCLGTFDVSLYEMVGAYSTFMNQGVYTKPFFISKIEDRFGNVIYEFQKERKYVINKELAWTMTYMLRGATEEPGGTGMSLYRKDYGALMYHNQIGGKTGTTQNGSDGWFMGVTPQIVAGAWVGAEHRSIHFRSLKYGQGGRMALPIFGKFMQKVYADKTLGIKKQKFPAPDFKLNFSLDCEEEQQNEEGESDTFIQQGSPVITEDLGF